MAEDEESGKPEGGSGAPRWTYGVTAIVGAVALAWGITKFLVERSEARRTSAPPTSAAASAKESGNNNYDVSVSGNGNQIIRDNYGDVTHNVDTTESVSAKSSGASASSSRP